MSSHVFLSYVKENAIAVDRLREEFISRHIETWMDIYNITPGARWELAIRRAIKEADFFIACFSSSYYHRDGTWMNKELHTAIEKLQQLHIGSTWFIPVKLEPCEIPEGFDIGSGATLQKLQYVELYQDWNAGVEQLAAVILAGRAVFSHSSAHSAALQTPLVKNSHGSRSIKIREVACINAEVISNSTDVSQAGDKSIEIDKLKAKKLKIEQ